MITMTRCAGGWRLLIVDEPRCAAQLMHDLYLDRLGVPFGPAWLIKAGEVYENGLNIFQQPEPAFFVPLPNFGGVAVGYRYDCEVTP